MEEWPFCSPSASPRRKKDGGEWKKEKKKKKKRKKEKKKDKEDFRIRQDTASATDTGATGSQDCSGRGEVGFVEWDVQLVRACNVSAQANTPVCHISSAAVAPMK
jgi:hypothetical protein